MFLTDPQRKKLAACGLNGTTTSMAQLHAGSPKEVRDLLGYGAGSGMVIPYDNSYAIVRLDDKNQDRRYRCPKGRGNRLYIPPTLPAGILEDTSQPIYVTEGPLKSLKATQDGFPCVALNGVWGWKMKDPDDLDGPTIPIPDLDLIKWNDRDVVVVFDADIKPKTVQDVRRAELVLTQELADRGAKVSVVRLPPPTGKDKVGLDDYLVQFGAPAFAALPRVAPDQDDPGVDQAIKKVEQAADLGSWRYSADRKVLGWALVLAWARQSLTIPLYVRSVSEMTNMPSSTVRRTLTRLCLNGWFRRDPDHTSYFHILEQQAGGGGSYLGGPPILGHEREGSKVGPKTVGHDPEEGERGEGSGKVGPQTVPHSSKEPNWAGTARLLERAVPDAHRPRHDVWHPRALGPCLRTYRLLIGMGEASAKILAALEEKPVKTVLARLRRLRASGLAAFAGKWRPIRAPIEHFDDVARQFNVVGLRAHEKATREALHRQERVTYRKRNKGKKPMTAP